MAVTIGDVIEQKKQADAAEAEAQAAAELADKAFADAQAGALTCNLQLKVGLGKVGPVFIQSTDGSVEIWMPDASDTGFHVFKPAAVSTILEPDPPAPTPDAAPMPDVAPTPDAAPTPDVAPTPEATPTPDLSAQ
jgi:hypothetical protein